MSYIIIIIIIIIITSIVIFILLCTYQWLFWRVEPWDIPGIGTRMYTNPPTQEVTITPPHGAWIEASNHKVQYFKGLPNYKKMLFLLFRLQKTLFYRIVI